MTLLEAVLLTGTLTLCYLFIIDTNDLKRFANCCFLGCTGNDRYSFPADECFLLAWFVLLINFPFHLLSGKSKSFNNMARELFSSLVPLDFHIECK